MTQSDKSEAAIEIEGRQFAFQAGRISSMSSLALVIVIVLFVVSSFLSAFDLLHISVIVAAVVSLPILFLYPLLTPRDGNPPRRSVFSMLVGLGAFVPYGLGCYLTFYEGLWGLVRLFSVFTVLSLFWSLACCILGFVIVNRVYMLTELCRAVDQRRIIVRSAS